VRIAEIFLSELDREHERSRRALEQVPEGRRDWKPHERSMNLGYLAEIVANIHSWVAMAINQNELDLNPPDGRRYKPEPLLTRTALLEALDKSTAAARGALETASDDALLEPWRLLVATKVVSESPRYVAIRDLLNHSAHHRGQLTVYLRLLGATVPALYGPSADDPRFA
jgi:uncharacterized damage-inducible protein DinB